MFACTKEKKAAALGERNFSMDHTPYLHAAYGIKSMRLSPIKILRVQRKK